MLDTHIIDVHQHCIPPEYKAALDECDITNRAMLDAPVHPGILEKQLAGMDEAGVAIGMLSITGCLLYSRPLARKCNEFFTKIISDQPQRLGAFASLPLPNLEGTLREIAYALDVLKLDGVGLLANVQGHYLGDPEYADIFNELNRRKAMVCIYPNDPPFGYLGKVKAPWAMIEFPLETTRTIGLYVVWRNFRALS
jgi:6-methylsalicylate decarboxylase